MRRRGRRRPVLLPLTLACVLVGAPGMAYTAGLVLPVPKVGRTPVAYTNHLPTRVSDDPGTLTYTGMVVAVPVAVTAAKGQVRIKVKQPLAAETPWTTCGHVSGTSWRCTYATPLSTAGGATAITAHVALP